MFRAGRQENDLLNCNKSWAEHTPLITSPQKIRKKGFFFVFTKDLWKIVLYYQATLGVLRNCKIGK